ncbi:MAG: divalent-cation tolerance protein CutA [Gemmatimonadales bacterium]
MSDEAAPGNQVVEVVTTLYAEALAQQLAGTLIAERLAACVQREGPIASTYRWDGRIEAAAEWRLVCKTAPDRAAALVDRIRRLHPYEQPEILIATREADPGYAAWVARETAA